MKRLISAGLSLLMLIGMLTACAPAQDSIDPAITLASSDASVGAEWLDERFDKIPDDVVIGIGSSESYGIDMEDFEDDGYILREMNGDVLIFGKTEAGLDLAVRKYAKAAENGQTEGLDLVYHEGLRIEKLTIAGNDISEYTIYYPKENNESMLFGVTELQRLVEMACGVKLPSKEGAPKGKYISFAFTTDETIRDAGYTYEVKGGNVIIEGKDDYGCPNAVYRLLQEECGWEGLCSGDSLLTEAEHVDIEEGISYVGNPRFDYFLTPYTLIWNSDRIKPTNAQKSFGRSEGIVYGGRVRHANHGMHTNNWAQQDEAHNYFFQICYTNESIFLTSADSIEAYIQSAIDAGQEIGRELKCIDISQVDQFAYCKCSGCMKVCNEEGGVFSGAVVRWANQIDEELDARGCDGVKYLIFAYHGSNVPCETPPSDDVYVTFCTDGHCSNHPLTGEECYGASFDMDGWLGEGETFNNNDYAEWIRGWCELSDNIYVWYYGLGGGLHGTLEYYDTIYEDLKFLEEAGVYGVYFNFNAKRYYNQVTPLMRVYNEAAYSFNWDPDMTAEEFEEVLCYHLEDEFGDGWYYIRECMNLVNEAERRLEGCFNCWGSTSLFGSEYYIEVFETVFDYAQKALSLVNTSRQEEFCASYLASIVCKRAYSGYFMAYDANDTETLSMLEECWAVMVDALNDAGLDREMLTVTGDTCEEQAWTVWKGDRDELTPEGTTQRPMPKKYETAEE